MWAKTWPEEIVFKKKLSLQVVYLYFELKKKKNSLFLIASPLKSCKNHQRWIIIIIIVTKAREANPTVERALSVFDIIFFFSARQLCYTWHIYKLSYVTCAIEGQCLFDDSLVCVCVFLESVSDVVDFIIYRVWRFFFFSFIAKAVFWKMYNLIIYFIIVILNNKRKLLKKQNMFFFFQYETTGWK